MGWEIGERSEDQAPFKVEPLVEDHPYAQLGAQGAQNLSRCEPSTIDKQPFCGFVAWVRIALPLNLVNGAPRPGINPGALQKQSSVKERVFYLGFTL